MEKNCNKIWEEKIWKNKCKGGYIDQANVLEQLYHWSVWTRCLYNIGATKNT